MVRYQPHPEVWVLVAALIGLGVYAVRVIGPKAVRDGSPIVTGRQTFWFFSGVLLLWAAADWPVHDIAEQRLYSVHMVQHLAMAYAVAPMFLLATPTWLAKLVLGEGRWLRRLCHPIFAGVTFNIVTVFLHWPAVVNHSVQNGPLHYSLHVLLVFAALLMWMPVCGPMPDLRISLPAQMIYLFLMSVVPTVPSAWLIFADTPVYKVYDIPQRMWGWSVIDDQQIAGLIMKLVAGFYLWGLIMVLFFKWAYRNQAANKAGRTLSERQILTWDDVKDELTTPAEPKAPTGS
jgi:putative membrane protein